MTTARRIASTAAGICILYAAVLGSSGCRTQPADPRYFRDGKQYGVYDGLWRDRWWNYYGRARSYAEGGFWDEAAADLLTALDRRGAVTRDPVDQYMARTYGTHFIDFFAHRELGVIYYEQGLYDQAITELHTSRAQTDTAKARYYLDQARADRVRQTGADRTDPRIAVRSAGTDGVTTEFTVRVTGTVTDDTYVAAINVDGEDVRIPLASPAVDFDVTVPVRRGRNSLKVRATDIVGRTAETYVNIVGDREGPAVNLTSPNPLETVRSLTVELNGTVTDMSGVASLRIGNRRVDGGGSAERSSRIEFREDVELNVGQNAIEVDCVDLLGNVTRCVINLVCRPMAAGVMSRPFAVAGLDDGPVTLCAAAGPVPALQIKRQTAKGVEEILKPWHVYRPEVRIIVGVFSAASAMVRIDGGAGTAIEDIVPAGMTMRTYAVKLERGDNTVRITAETGDVPPRTRSIRLVRHPVGIEDMAWRLQIAAMPPGCSTDEYDRPESSSFIHTQYQREMFASGRFRLVERARLDSVLREQELTLAGLTDPKSAVKVGKIVAAEALILSDVRETNRDIQILQRVVDAETGLVLAMADTYCENTLRETVKMRVAELAADVRDAFPLLEGAVVSTRDDHIYIDLGSQDGVRRGYRLNVVTRGDPVIDERNGEVLLDAQPEIAGSVSIDEVFPRQCRALVPVEPGPVTPIRPGLEVWTR